MLLQSTLYTYCRQGVFPPSSDILVFCTKTQRIPGTYYQVPVSYVIFYAGMYWTKSSEYVWCYTRYQYRGRMVWYGIVGSILFFLYRYTVPHFRRTILYHVPIIEVVYEVYDMLWCKYCSIAFVFTISAYCTTLAGEIIPASILMLISNDHYVPGQSDIISIML